MSIEFGYAVLFKGHYYSNHYSLEGYTVQYHKPGSVAPQNRTCATLSPEVVNRCAALDMVPVHERVNGVGYWYWSYIHDSPHYALSLWAPIEDIFDLDPR